ncbi:MAG: septum formation initiator family protein [Candidatus Moranbacteria bacterium]|nr:septum formation initiator family protein [Candidatus Moranbacteria bacterium]
MAQRRWWLRMVVVAVLILIGWVLYVSSKQVERNRRIQEEIGTLETEAAKISRENETLSERISYFASDDFREQEAKKKLGLKKTEETVVEVKPAPGYENGGEASRGESQVSSKNSEDESAANYKKWWKVFFGVR